MVNKLLRREIVITHYNNPSEFWFKLNQINDELAEFEQLLLRYVLNASSNKRRSQKPAINDVVMILYRPIGKWARARVVKISADGTMVTAWAIDHGAPITSSTKFVIPLNDENLAHKQIVSVFKAGICNVEPANGVVSVFLSLFNGQTINFCFV